MKTKKVAKNKSATKKGAAKPVATVPANWQPTVMVASTIYNSKADLIQIIGYLTAWGYKVINSDYGTVRPIYGKGNTDACLKAVDDCHIFLGIIWPMYSSGITHKEFKRAIATDKHRYFIAHSFVPYTRQLLAQFMYKKDKQNKKQRTPFKLESKTPVMDDLRVIDMYNEVIQDDLPLNKRQNHWVQEFFTIDQAFRHLETIFGDIERVKKELTTPQP